MTAKGQAKQASALREATAVMLLRLNERALQASARGDRGGAKRWREALEIVAEERQRATSSRLTP